MFWERCYISCQFWGKITIGFRNILVVNSEKTFNGVLMEFLTDCFLFLKNVNFWSQKASVFGQMTEFLSKVIK